MNTGTLQHTLINPSVSQSAEVRIKCKILTLKTQWLSTTCRQH